MTPVRGIRSVDSGVSVTIPSGDEEHTVFWRVPDPDALLWEAWDGDYSIFDTASGETHLLNELPAEILRRLSARAYSVSQLAEALSIDCETENSVEWVQKIRGVVKNFDTLGLVEPTVDDPR